MIPRVFNPPPQTDIRPRYRVARTALTVYCATFLLGALLVYACNYAAFFKIMAMCALVALACGSRLQRQISAVLLVIAVVGAIYYYRADHDAREQGRKERMKKEEALLNTRSEVLTEATVDGQNARA